LHPGRVFPQPGVTDIEQMDYIFVCFDDTVSRLSARYNVNIDGAVENGDETVTQICAYYKNGKGGIGLFSWASATVLEDDEEYTARKRRVCKKCGREYVTEKCVCGSDKFELSAKKSERLLTDVTLSDGITVIAAGTEIPFYEPDALPVIPRKNVAVFGKFFGEGDCEKIRDLQSAHNALAKKVQQKILKGGSVLTLPRGVRIETSDKEDKLVYLDTPVQKNLIDAISLQPSVQQDLQMLNKYYEDARTTLGITDSFQGRDTSAAESGVAKQFSASQSASRLEHKKKLKNASYVELYRTLFKYMLSYADEPRRYVGKEEFEIPAVTFNRYDFLERDENGDYYFDDEYIFEVDASASEQTDRNRLWQEAYRCFSSGAFGEIGSEAALLRLWKRLEALDYPGATGILRELREASGKEGIYGQ